MVRPPAAVLSSGDDDDDDEDGGRGGGGTSEAAESTCDGAECCAKNNKLATPERKRSCVGAANASICAPLIALPPSAHPSGCADARVTRRL